MTAKDTAPAARGHEASLHAQVIVMSAVVNLAALGMPVAVLQVYDRIIPNHSEQTAVVMVVGVTLAVLAEAILRIARSHIMGRVATRFERVMNRRAVAHLFATDLKTFQSQSTGTHLERLGAIATLRDHASGQTLLALYDIPFAVASLALIAFFGGVLVAVACCGLLTMALLAVAVGRSAQSAQAEVARAEDERSGFIISIFSGIQSVKAMALELPLLRRYEALQARRLAAHATAELHAQHLTEAGQFVAQLSSLATVAFGSLLVLDGVLTVGGLSACTLLVGRTLAPAQGLMALWSRRQPMKVASKKLDDLFALPKEPPATGILDAATARPDLHFDSVGFAFSGRPVLRDVDLRVSQGEAVALVGPTGGGKSTLLALAAGLYRPATGRVLLDGLPLDVYDPATLRRSIALLSHRETLFRGTVIDNITMFQPDVLPAAMAAAEQVGIVTAINAMPHGFATIVGDGATEPMPRGLAQRIAIARALVQKPRLILFDDANAAADDEGDRVLLALLADLRTSCATLFVSHRPLMLKHATSIFRLSDGHLDRTPELAA
ncbi:peptidase domain-containing ABC transporter [Azospirillum picis]|uniref:ATP-binding cassette subfamily C protein LapB n=1 Tax=Azospirillum picis TaxID=488438 RepID=A0ABU0MMJ1_9PROT|nr:ABC transporter transmembrane domain-containing protein [Azospirillum picis]MBP2300652.1 ATP-binding cassette subfamily C protein LapB [Azospirillum picis]MDQ0534621.1 ATP-binding cassette subfamily C protein LapB [Azospirillum picis]